MGVATSRNRLVIRHEHLGADGLLNGLGSPSPAVEKLGVPLCPPRRQDTDLKGRVHVD